MMREGTGKRHSGKLGGSGCSKLGEVPELTALKPAVFFDRDGTLIVDTGYLSSPDEVTLLPGAARLLLELRAAGYLLVVISNQSGIGRGWISEEQARSVDGRFRALLFDRGITLDAIYYCPHAPEVNCDCRKPNPGLLRRAAAEMSIDLTRSYMIGDRVSDCEAGEAAGCRPILLVHDNSAEPSRWTTAHDLPGIFELITATDSERRLTS